MMKNSFIEKFLQDPSSQSISIKNGELQKISGSTTVKV